MSEFQNISEEEDYYQQLFDMAEKEQKGDLYKKDLYIMKEDLEKIKSKSKLKVMHDNILKKLINEDYRDFILIIVKLIFKKKIMERKKLMKKLII